MAYVTVSDLRSEGVPSDPYSDEEVQAAIDFASEYIERITLKYFEARTETRTFDGNGSETLPLDMPIVTLTKVEWQQFGNSPLVEQPLTEFKAYNRVPTDQYYPKIAIFRSNSWDIESRYFGVFPRGTLNIAVTGSWGWLEKQADGTLVTPKQIKKIVKILAVAWLDQIGGGGLLSVLRSYGITEEKTDRHSYKLSEAMSGGSLTGIPIVDMVLRRYMARDIAFNV